MLFFQTTFFVILVFVIDVLTAIHILMNKHEQPVSATLWLFIVFSFPLFGVILYLFLGINRIKTLGLKIAMANEAIDTKLINLLFALRDKFIYTEYAAIADPMQYNKTIDRLIPETSPLVGNKLELLRDGTTAYPKMLQAIKNAKHNINLQSFIIHNDVIGQEILDALLKKAKQGVQIKVLYDKFGSMQVFSRAFARYKKIPNFTMTPFAFTNILAPWRVQLRNHRKLLVVDGNTAFIGGINISKDNDINVCNKDKYIHDLHCKILGPAVIPLQLSFLRDWHYATKAPLATIFQPAYFPDIKSQGKSIVRVVDTGPGQKDEATEKVFFTATATAKKSLWIMTPYFTPDHAFIAALIMAAARGVEIRIIMPKLNNHWFVQFASRSLYKLLLTNNIRIFEKTGVFSHTKAMLVDGEWGYMGSSNCNVRSFRLNYELDFVVADGDFIPDLHDQFIRELEKSEEISLNTVLQKKLPIQLLENLCSLLTPIL
jgi:cardiolipin synthase